MVENTTQGAFLSLRRHCLRSRPIPCRLRSPRHQCLVRYQDSERDGPARRAVEPLHRSAATHWARSRCACLGPHRARLHYAGELERESSTHAYLCEQGLSAVLSADLAFLYPYVDTGPRSSIPDPYRLIFLRSNNLDSDALRLEQGALFEGSRLIAEASSDRLILATSDYRRDERFLARAARRLGVAWIACQSVPDLVTLIASSSGVVSDRYHPAICAAVLGKPAQVLSNREPHKMQGLKNLLADNTLDELQTLARTGLRTLRDALTTCA